MVWVRNSRGQHSLMTGLTLEDSGLGKVLSFGDLLDSFSPMLASFSPKPASFLTNLDSFLLKLVAVFYENFHYFGSIIVEKLVSF